MSPTTQGSVFTQAEMGGYGMACVSGGEDQGSSLSLLVEQNTDLMPKELPKGES